METVMPLVTFPMGEPVIVAAARSPIGRAFKGSMTSVRPDDLLAQVIEAVLEMVSQLDSIGIFRGGDHVDRPSGRDPGRGRRLPAACDHAGGTCPAPTSIPP